MLEIVENIHEVSLYFLKILLDMLSQTHAIFHIPLLELDQLN